ncbi:MAG: hypothetical protein U0802_13220 [Candidatus Binatia bacterium]
MAMLFGLEVANASMYGGLGTAEAALMAACACTPSGRAW